MNLGRFVREVLSVKEATRGIVRKQEELYASVRVRRPNDEPHALLAQVWLSRAVLSGNTSFPADFLTQVALNDTFLFACLPEGKNARALGLYLAQREAPQVFAQCPEMPKEYTLLMKPLGDAVDADTILELYQSLNPTTLNTTGGELKRLVRELRFDTTDSPLLLPLTDTGIWPEQKRGNDT